MPEPIFDRDAVREALKRSGVTHEAFAEAVGLTHKSAVAKILKGERGVKVEEAARINDYLRLVPVDHDTTRTIPIIGFASAGSWREAIEMPIGRMVIPSGAAGQRAFAVEVKGDSMNELIDDGGWIVADPDDKALADGKVYLLRNPDHEVTVKRYRTHPARFEPVSSNEEHQSFLASDHDITVLGRIVWKGSPL